MRIKDDSEFNLLRDQQGRSTAPAHVLPGDSYLMLPTHPRDNLLIREVETNRKFIIQGGTAFEISSDWLLETLRTPLPPEDRVVHAAPAGLGTSLKTRTPRNHTLLREIDYHPVYLLMGGIKHYLDNFNLFLPMGVDPERIRLVPPGALSRYTTGDGRMSGNIDGIDRSNNTLRGWTVDLDSPSNTINVFYTIDGTVMDNATVRQAPTTVYRPDVNDYFQHLEAAGTHGFALPIPDDYRDGNPHDIYVIMQDAQNMGWMSFSTYTFQF